METVNENKTQQSRRQTELGSAAIASTPSGEAGLGKPRRYRLSRWNLALVAAPLLGALGLGLGTGAVALAQPYGGPGMGMADGGEHGPGMHHRMDQMLTTVGATDAQKAQIKTIWEGARPQLKTAREEHEQVRRQITEALAAPTVDAARIEQLRKQSVQAMDKVSSVMTQAFVATANVLTPAQRKLAAEKFEEKAQERHEGHRGGPRGAGSPGAAGTPATGAGQ